MATARIHENGAYEGYRVSVRLVRDSPCTLEPYVMRGAGDVHRLFEPLSSLDREVFYAAHLDVKHRVMACEEVSRGTLDQALVHPREVYKAAILSSASAIIAVHNHPSGDPSPSREDYTMTDRLVRAGKLIGIPLIDHVIIGDGRYCSLSEMNRI